MYLGHSSFHARSVALVWNPTTVCASPQYHVVFDNDFSTVPYMESGTIPPNWENLVKYSSKMTTSQDVDLAYTWLRGKYNEGAPDPLSYPFAIVTGHYKRQKMNTSVSASSNKNIPISASKGDKSHESSWPTSQPVNQSAANPFANARSISNNGRSGFQIDTFNSNPYSDSLSHNYDTQSLIMPKRMNPRENGLCLSTRLRELRGKEELQKRKVHTTCGTATATKVAFGVFSSFYLVSSVTIPNH